MGAVAAAAVVCVEGILLKKKTKRDLAYNLRPPLAGVTLGELFNFHHKNSN